MKTKRNNSKKRLLIPAAFALLLLTVNILSTGSSFAKYMEKQSREDLYTAKTFYFSSEYLQPMEVNGGYVSHTIQEGINDITFHLRNYDDALRTSDVDISYDIYLDNVQLTDKSGTIAVGDGGESVSITLHDLNVGRHFVTAVATAPYTKTIGAYFVIESTEPAITYQTYGSAADPKLQLTVQTNDYAGNVLLSWGNGIVPDQTDEKLNNILGNAGSCTIYLNSNSEYTFTFLKSDLTVDLKNTLKASIVNG